MDVYAQLQKRFKRSHGVSFDRLVRETSEQVKVLPQADADPLLAPVVPIRAGGQQAA